MYALARIIFIVLLLTPAVSCAQSTSQGWRWYHSSFDSPWSKGDMLIRVGTAQVVLDDRRVFIKLRESGFPELKASFNGSLSKGGKVKGSLDGFILHGDYSEILLGTYQEQDIIFKGNKGKCHMQEIILRPSYVTMNGSVFVLVKAQGMCEERVLIGPKGPVDDF